MPAARFTGLLAAWLQPLSYCTGEVAMSHNFYSEINLHLVWHTKVSMPLLTPQVAAYVHRFLRQYLVNMPGAYVHEIGGIETHIHVAVSIAPTILVSDLVGKLKGASSHEANRQIGRGRKVLEWQAGYGVVSFGTGDLEWVRAYIHNQPEHHARGTTHDRLERIAPAEDSAKAPSPGSPVNRAPGRDGEGR
jgi:REP element-mobilizing transposase RayT